jgi:hypothetical protein
MFAPVTAAGKSVNQTLDCSRLFFPTNVYEEINMKVRTNVRAGYGGWQER